MLFVWKIQVAAFDGDSLQNGDVKFQNLNGNDLVKESFQIDMNTGEIYLLSNEHIDRETNESKFDTLIKDCSFLKLIIPCNC